MELGKQKKVIATINGEQTEVTLQHPGIEWSLELAERNINVKTGRPSQIKIAKDMLENAVINPKLTVNDFKSPAECLNFINDVVDPFLDKAE